MLYELFLVVMYYESIFRQKLCHQVSFGFSIPNCHTAYLISTVLIELFLCFIVFRVYHHDTNIWDGSDLSFGFVK